MSEEGTPIEEVSDVQPTPKEETKVISTDDLLEQTKRIDELVQGGETVLKKPEVGAATLARMAGLATASELKILENKIDLLAGRLANITSRTEKILTALEGLPSGNDFERLDVGIANAREMLRELVSNARGGEAEGGEVTKDKLDAFLKRHNNKGGDADSGKGAEEESADQGEQKLADEEENGEKN